MTIEQWMTLTRVPECDRINYEDTPEGVWTPEDTDGSD